MTVYRVKGLEQITSVMRSLPKEITDKVLAKVVTTGAAIVRDAAKAIVPEVTGLLKSNIIIVKDKKPHLSGFDARAIVWVKYDPKKGGSWYWRWVEFGTSKMAARPFLRPAFETRKEVALAAMISVAAEEIPKIVNKLGGGK